MESRQRQETRNAFWGAGCTLVSPLECKNRFAVPPYFYLTLLLCFDEWEGVIMACSLAHYRKVDRINMYKGDKP